MSRSFVTRVFDRWARKERILDSALITAVEGADAGLVDANLRGCLIKLRVARRGAGKSGGYRTIVAYRDKDRAFFLYGFGKNERSNIQTDEAQGFDEYGMILLGLTELEAQLAEGKLRRLIDGKDLQE